MEKHASITQHYYRGSHFVLLVYSATDEFSLHKLDGIADGVKIYEPAAKLILVRNKTDLPIGDEGISPEKEKAFICNMKRRVCAHFWTSAKKNEGVDELLKEIAKHCLKMFKSRRESEDYQDNRNDGFRLDLSQNKQENDGIRCCN